MRTKNFIAFFFVVTFLSNCSPKEELGSILSADCYWDVLDKGSPHPINSCYKFKEDGTCKFFYYNFFDKKKTDSVYLYDEGDIVVPNKWVLIKDTILIRSSKFSVIRYSQDSVFLKAISGDMIVLIKNCVSYNPKDKSNRK